MYSFEGKFRTTPTVSLGGKRKQEKLDKGELLQKAQKERQKREEIRRRLHSALIIQSSVRSFLVRQRLKRHLRNQFDAGREVLNKKKRNFDDLVPLSQWLKFFYSVKEDNERLAWFGQHLLRSKEEWISKDGSNLFSTSGVLKLCIRCLSNVDLSASIAISLRMMETFTSQILIENGRCLEENVAQLCTLKLWDALVKNGYFTSILHLLSTRVPSDIGPPTSEGPIYPPTPLAETLLELLVKPVIAAGRFSGKSSPADENSMDTSDSASAHLHHQSQILKSFTTQILCKNPTTQLYYYVYPALGESPDFPVEIVLATVDELDTKPPGLLAALVKFVHPKLDSMSETTFVGYLHCVQCLINRLPRIRHSSTGAYDVTSSDSDSDDDGATLGGSSMDYTPYDGQGNTISLTELVSDCHLALASQPFIDACVGRKIHEYSSSESLDSICAICYHLIVVRKVNVQKNRLLYTLAFSSSFLRKLWNSTITTSTASKITGKSIPLVQLLFEGSPMTEKETGLIQSKLVVFCALFHLNLLSVHDTDFYTVAESSHHMAFKTSELVGITLTMRDVCLALIKRALPETRTRTIYNVKSVLHALSFGHAVIFEKVHGSKDAESEMKDINDTVFLFMVCRKLVKHLHTRDSRRSFIPKDLWMSNSILVKTDQSSDFAQRWHRRTETGSAVAAHLANTADEDIILSVTEARQLAVLMNIPFVIPFQTRVSIFMEMLRKDRDSRESMRDRIMGEAGLGPATMTNEVTVRRDFLYEDAFNDLSPENAPDLRKRLRATFVNAMGLDEAGYGAGVTREFLQQVVKAGFDPTRGFFKTTTQGRLYPNPHASAITQDVNDHFYFLGRMLGKVIYEGMQVELPFASFFLCKILQRKNTDVDINHLQSLDPDFYKNLMYLHEYDGDISDLDLNFTVVDETLGVTKVTELMQDGKNTPVTNANKVLYMHLMANYKLNVQMRSPSFHFRRGLEDVVNVDWLQMFDHEEFQTLVAGAEIPIDIEDLKQHAAYSGGYTAENATITLFWEVLNDLTNSQLGQLLLFVTSCSRPPLLGFKELQPPFCIQRGGTDDRLPSASTCLNLLKLPEYQDAETLKSKLIYCLQSQTGFELS